MTYTKTGPFVDGGAPYLSAAFFNALEASVSDAVNGTIVAPAPTGNATTDTANLQTAITTANNTYCDLILAPAAGGTIKSYLVNTALSWNLNRGSIYGRGLVTLDFSAVPTTYTGAALTLTTNLNGGDGSHLSALHRVQGFRMLGHNTDTSTMDGIVVVEASPGFGNDQGIVESVYIKGFRDGITFGTDVWTFDFRKVAVDGAHRWGINLANGTGENAQFSDCSVFGCHNAAGTAAAVYAPAGNNIDARFFGGSLDYNDIEGVLQGGNISFHALHIEDNNTGPMFTYTRSSGTMNIAFRDCDWDNTAPSVRPYLHNILAGTGTDLTLTFDGDKGGMYPGTMTTWLIDSSGNRTGDLGISSTIRGWAINAFDRFGQFYSLLTNGDFGASSSFVASPGIGGWAAYTSGTWSIGAGGSPGAALKLVASTAVTGSTTQRIRIPMDGRPLRIAGRMQVTALTSGSIQGAIQFLAEDGSTVINVAGNPSTRIGGTLSTVDATNWTLFAKRFSPPPGASYLVVQLGANGFVGTGLWDEIEVVPC